MHKIGHYPHFRKFDSKFATPEKEAKFAKNIPRQSMICSETRRPEQTPAAPTVLYGLPFGLMSRTPSRAPRAACVHSPRPTLASLQLQRYPPRLSSRQIRSVDGRTLCMRQITRERRPLSRVAGNVAFRVRQASKICRKFASAGEDLPARNLPGAEKKCG